MVASLEQQFSPMMQAEFSVLVDVLHSPELLFPEGSDARIRCGAFMSKYVSKQVVLSLLNFLCLPIKRPLHSTWVLDLVASHMVLCTGGVVLNCLCS